MFYLHLKYDWVQRFDALVTKMKSLPIWQQMINTVEDSPWHREANVAVHTEMVVDQAVWFAADYQLSARDAKILFLATFFHDFGKPEAEEICTVEETGEIYRRYSGHESISARLFEQIYMSNYKDFEDWVTPEEAHAVTFLIEHHLPYKVTDKQKRLAYGWAMQAMFDDGPNVLYCMLCSDTWGRISDDQDAKKMAVLEWVKEFAQMYEFEIANTYHGFNVQKYVRLVFLVGPSGAGKSTVAKELIDLGWKHYSWDDLRVEFYKQYIQNHNEAVLNSDVEVDSVDELMDLLIEMPEDEKELYRQAFKHWSSEENEKEFNRLQQERFSDLLKKGERIVVDNTNLTRKRRRGMLHMAAQHKYRTKAIYFQTSLEMLFQRAQRRSDKRLPLEVVERQFKSVQVPFIGEFYEVEVRNPHRPATIGTDLGYGLLPQ